MPAVKAHYVNQLVEQLSIGEAKTILTEKACVQPDKNLDRLHAQMRSLASQDQNVGRIIIDLLKSRGKKRSVLELLQCKDLPEHVIWINLIRRIDLTELEQHELRTIHTKIIGKEIYESLKANYTSPELLSGYKCERCGKSDQTEKVCLLRRGS